MVGQKIDPRRFRLIVDQRGFTNRDLARCLRARGVLVTAEAIKRLGNGPPSALPPYVNELVALLKTKVGYLVGEHGQFMAKRFRDLYFARGYTLAQLAEDLAAWNVCITPQYLQQLAAGRNTNPRQEIVDGLALLLRTTPDYLLGLHDDPEAPREAETPAPGWVRIAARGGLDGVPADLRRILAVIAQQEAQDSAGKNPGSEDK